METQQITLYAHYCLFNREVTYFVTQFNDDFYVYLGEQEVTVTIPDHSPELIKQLQIEQLESYVESPLYSTIFVICYKYKTLDSRKKLIKESTKKGFDAWV